MRRIVLLVLLSLSLFSASHSLVGQSAKPTSRDSVVLLGINDIHAALEQFPRFSFMVDSLRGLYPDLRLVGAGDYNSGNPLNDAYNPAGYPIIAMMNAVGFDVSTVGNHEFDVGQDAFGLMTRVASFPFVCANMKADEKFGMAIEPYIIEELPNGIKVAYIGAIQLESNGLPATHKNNVEGIAFTPIQEVLPHYRHLRDSVDFVVLVSHLGIEEDRQVAGSNPWLDLIIGGHSHTYVEGAETIGDVFVTQAGNGLRYGTLIKVYFEGKERVETKAKTFAIERAGGREKASVAKLLRWFGRNPFYREVVAIASEHFKDRDALGYLMCDAYREETNSQIAFQNSGGVRIDNLLRGPITVLDVYKLDPFGNELMTVMLTGREIEEFVKVAWEKDYKTPIYCSGLHIAYQVDKAGELVALQLTDQLGKPLRKDTLYKVAYSDYIHTAYPFVRQDTPQGIGKTTAQVTIDFLRKKGTLEDYGKKPSRLAIITGSK